MNTFRTNERALSVTDHALYLTVTKSAGEVGAMAHGGLIGALIALLIRKVIERKDKNLQADPNINFDNQSSLVTCRVVDLPGDILHDPQWPKVRDGAKVQVIPRASISELKLTPWTGLKLRTQRDEKVKFPVAFWRVKKLRAALASLGYLPQSEGA